MLFVSMLFGLLVLGPLIMLIVFAIVRSEQAMAWLRRLARPRPAAPPVPPALDGEPDT